MPDVPDGIVAVEGGDLKLAVAASVVELSPTVTALYFEYSEVDSDQVAGSLFVAITPEMRDRLRRMLDDPHQPVGRSR